MCMPVWIAIKLFKMTVPVQILVREYNQIQMCNLTNMSMYSYDRL